MSNIQIESDLKEILNKLDSRLDNLQKDLTEIKVGQTEVKGDIKRLDSNISTLKEDIKEIKGSQKAQICAAKLVL
jgi:peptidoglycan hydrolase CwlO-like protein